LGKFWRALEREMLVYFLTIWNILWPFGIINGRLVGFAVIWNIFSQFGMFGRRKIWQPCHPIPRRDSISRPIAPVSSVAGGDETPWPRRQGTFWFAHKSCHPVGMRPHDP
jgi:hypothetical protein